MKAYSILGIISLLAAAFLSCVAGAYAATNPPVALGIALTACLALLVGVKWVAERR